ncbi:hypothetical protein BTH42_32645 [Burkholderia sp. SRS-W-2-2016]|nr:hypothetical protein BTH42_32645 [Burkholderia sp. SRS-W-2-2016]
MGSLDFVILHGSRDIAVAFIDLTQRVARLGEASQTLLIPHSMPEPLRAAPLEVHQARGRRAPRVQGCPLPRFRRGDAWRADAIAGYRGLKLSGG